MVRSGGWTGPEATKKSKKGLLVYDCRVIVKGGGVLTSRLGSRYAGTAEMLMNEARFPLTE